MEIQQHDGVVVDVAGSRQGFAELLREGEVLQGRREAPKAVAFCPPSPPLYRPPGRGAAAKAHLGQGAAAKGGEGVALPPKARGKLPPLGFPTLGAWGEAQGGRPSPLRAGSLPLSAHGALRDRWPHPVDPRDPSGGPGTIPVTPETFPMAET